MERELDLRLSRLSVPCGPDGVAHMSQSAGIAAIPDSDEDGSEYDDGELPGPASTAMDTAQGASSDSAPAAGSEATEAPEPTPYPGATGPAPP